MYPIRCVNTRVFPARAGSLVSGGRQRTQYELWAKKIPDPGPARTTVGPCGAVTAWVWAWFRPAKRLLTSRPAAVMTSGLDRSFWKENTGGRRDLAWLGVEKTEHFRGRVNGATKLLKGRIMCTPNAEQEGGIRSIMATENANTMTGRMEMLKTMVCLDSFTRSASCGFTDLAASSLHFRVTA
eukprot:3428051-Rhodomonas_salina.2